MPRASAVAFYRYDERGYQQGTWVSSRRGAIIPLTSEFSKIAVLPNFNSGGWRSEGSTHSASAYEHDLGDTGKVVKVYIGDRNFGGSNTVTIPDPTDSIGHYAAWPHL